MQRETEVIQLDPHIQEAADHVDHVVGVDRGENQVAGERGLNGDLRRLRVADFTTMILSGSWRGSNASRGQKSVPFSH